MASETISKYLDEFEKLGLSRNEASVYLALLQNHPVTGYKLSKDSGILRPIVYEMLGRLVEKGGVKVVKSNPEQYSPVSPIIFLKSLTKRFTEVQSSLIQSLSDISNEKESDDFWSISSIDAISTSIIEMISHAQDSILLFCNDQKIAELIRDLLSKKVASGIRVMCVTYIDISLPGVELYYESIPDHLIKRYSHDIMIVTDTKFSLIANLEIQKSCQSQHPSQVLVVSEFIKMKIVLYRLFHAFPKSQLSLYLFDEDKEHYKA